MKNAKDLDVIPSTIKDIGLKFTNKNKLKSV